MKKRSGLHNPNAETHVLPLYTIRFHFGWATGPWIENPPGGNFHAPIPFYRLCSRGRPYRKPRKPPPPPARAVSDEEFRDVSDNVSSVPELVCI